MKLRLIFSILLSAIVLIACVKDEISLDDLSDEVRIKRDIAMPLVKGSFAFDDFFGNEADSLQIFGIDTIMLYIVEDIAFEDTIKLGDDFGDDVEIEQLNIYHTFKNSLPVGIDVKCYLYDSLSVSVIDSILFNDNPDEIFLEAAPVDAGGLVIESSVASRQGTISLDEEIFDKLFDQTTHLVLVAEVPSSGDFVKVLDHYGIEFKIDFAGTGYYDTNLESNN